MQTTIFVFQGQSNVKSVLQKWCNIKSHQLFSEIDLLWTQRFQNKSFSQGWSLSITFLNINGVEGRKTLIITQRENIALFFYLLW